MSTAINTQCVISITPFEAHQFHYSVHDLVAAGVGMPSNSVLTRALYLQMSTHYPSPSLARLVWKLSFTLHLHLHIKKMELYLWNTALLQAQSQQSTQMD